VGQEESFDEFSERNVGEPFSVNVVRKEARICVFEQTRPESPLSPGKPLGAVHSTTVALEGL
jgi:hypothetical protein